MEDKRDSKLVELTDAELDQVAAGDSGKNGASISQPSPVFPRLEMSQDT